MKTRAVKFDVEKILQDKIIGTGYNTTVNSYQSNDEQYIWVSKCIEVDNIDKLLQIMEEIVLSYSCDHENFNSIKGYCVVPTDKTNFKVYVKLPLMHENISSLYQKKPEMSEQEIIKILHSLIRGLEYLHSKGVAHQNVKPTNILVDNNGNAKLADISSEGYSDRRDRLNAQGDTNEIVYLPPEVLNDSLEIDLEKADIWSLGRCLFDLSPIDVLKQKGEEDQEDSALEEILKVEGSSDLSSLLQYMLSDDPNKRKTASEMKHIIETKFLSVKSELVVEKHLEYPKKSKNNANVNDEIEKKPWSGGK